MSCRTWAFLNNEYKVKIDLVNSYLNRNVFQEPVDALEKKRLKDEAAMLREEVKTWSFPFDLINYNLISISMSIQSEIFIFLVGTVYIFIYKYYSMLMTKFYVSTIR